MNRRNHVSRFDGIPKTKLQGSEASHPKSLQSQMPPRPENRLLLNSLRGYSRPTSLTGFLGANRCPIRYPIPVRGTLSLEALSPLPDIDKMAGDRGGGGHRGGDQV